MKEIPILYSTPMIQAKLEGRKFQTRRIMKVQPEEDCYFEMKLLIDVVGPAVCLIDYNSGEKNPYVRCPYGRVGDVLWARETWSKIHYEGVDPEPTYLYKADGVGVTGIWKPSIHMPKVASRIWERITDIRVERLRDISEEDAISEGVQENTCDNPAACPSFGKHGGCCGEGEWFNYLDKNQEGEPCYSAVESYRTLWERINGPGSWDLSPWVWVIESEILSTTGRQNAGLAVSKTERV